MTGYLRVASKSTGFNIQPSSETPLPMSTLKNSAGVLISVPNLAVSAAGSVNVRSDTMVREVDDIGRRRLLETRVGVERQLRVRAGIVVVPSRLR